MSSIDHFAATAVLISDTLVVISVEGDIEHIRLSTIECSHHSTNSSPISIPARYHEGAISINHKVVG